MIRGRPAPRRGRHHMPPHAARPTVVVMRRPKQNAATAQTAGAVGLESRRAVCGRLAQELAVDGGPATSLRRSRHSVMTASTNAATSTALRAAMIANGTGSRCIWRKYI